MIRKIIGFITAAAFLLSAVSVSAAYLDDAFTDDFSNADVSKSVWQYQGAFDRTNLSSFEASSDGLFITDDESLKITASSDSAACAIYSLEEPVTDNIKIKFKVKIPKNTLGYFGGTLTKSADSNTRTPINSMYFNTSNPNTALSVYWNHAYGVPSANGKTVGVIKNYDENAWYDVEITIYGETKEIGASIDGSAEVKTAFADGSYFAEGDAFYGITRLGAAAYKGTNTLEIDDVSIVKDIPLEVTAIGVEDGAVNVDTDSSFTISFNKDIDTANGIVLLKADNSAVEADISIDGRTIKVTPKTDLDSLSAYTLVIPAGIKAKDGKLLESEKIITFTTKLVDNLSIVNAAFDNNTFTADIKNSSSAPVNASARLTVYKLINGVKQYVKDITEDIAVETEYSYSKQITDLPGDYEVSLSILDTNLNPLCAEEAFDKNGRKVNLSDEVLSDSSNIDYANGIVSVAKNIGSLAYVHKAIEVKNESGEVIYFDQLLTNTNGAVKFDFVPASAVTADNYSITVNGTEMAQVLTESMAVDYARFAVSITKPEIKGGLVGGAEISSDYTFTSVIGEEEGNSVYEWLISDTADGIYTPITGAAGKAYTVADADEYRYIKTAVTPITKLGLAQGERTESDPVQIKTLPKAEAVGISGTASAGKLLTGTYTYSHKGNAVQSGTTYKWLTASSADGTYTEAGNGLTYALKSSDAGKYIKFAVVPACEEEPKTGKQAESEPVYVKAASTGGGGSSSGGVSFNIPVGYKSPEPLKETDETDTPEKNSFSDIGGHWAAENINTLFDRGIVNGDDNGNFNPDNNVTRAEFTAMIVRLLSLSEQEYIRMFDDVTADDWYAKAVQTAVSHGLVSGDGKSFRPDDNITREEMAVVLIGAYELNAGECETVKIDVTDAEQISQWAAEAVEKAYTLGLINGFEDGSFSPKTSATRAQSAAVMVRLIKCIEGVEE